MKGKNEKWGQTKGQIKDIRKEREQQKGDKEEEERRDLAVNYTYPFQYCQGTNQIMK